MRFTIGLCFLIIAMTSGEARIKIKQAVIMAEALAKESKRRRILSAAEIVPVPVYSSRVNNSLQLKPTEILFAHKEKSDDEADDSLCAAFSSRTSPGNVIAISDSDEEAEFHLFKEENFKKLAEKTRSPSPPPPLESPVQKQSRKVKKNINEFNRRFQSISSIVSPDARSRRATRCQTQSSSPAEEQDDDVIVVTASRGRSEQCSEREIPLKIRCRADIHRIPVLSSTPFGDVLRQLSVILKVPPHSLLLLRGDEELPTDSTVGEIGLGIADIIECVVVAAEEQSDSRNVITVKLQSKDRDSSKEFSIHKEAPLGSIFSQYLCGGAHRKVSFHFDGCRVKSSQTPGQLDMEDGDIIEVWK